MRIERLHLHNFRNFADQEFRFPARFTVVIGENGRGKSTLLAGLRLAMGDLPSHFRELAGMDYPYIRGKDVRRVDLAHRFAPQLPVRVAADVCPDPAAEPARVLHEVQELNNPQYRVSNGLNAYAADLERQTNQQYQEVDFPVLVFFGTSRLRPWEEDDEEDKVPVPLKPKGAKITDGYARALDGSGDLDTALAWIKSNYYIDLKAKVKGDDGNPRLAAVLEAIAACVPGWEQLEWDEYTDSLAGQYTDSHAGPRGLLPLRYLSDGQRAMAGLAAEIAYRCVTLNGHHGREAVRASRGVVLIDELDMHLHPNWQRHVVADLKRAFELLQFVVTTHSPFIVQALDSSELINLDPEHVTDTPPKDLRLEQVAEQMMGVESPFGVESQAKEDVATTYLDRLHAGATPADLDALEATITDPGLRAMLRMERRANGIPS